MSGPDFEGVLVSWFVSLPETTVGGQYQRMRVREVAAALRAELGRWLGSEGAVDVVGDALLDCNHNGMRCYDPMPIWPTARAALAALAECVGVEEVGA